jgi:hypothetical protein
VNVYLHSSDDIERAAKEATHAKMFDLKKKSTKAKPAASKRKK